jgi:peptidoglycan hydrolase-like protein with peptidoglycan-binding domain
VPASEGNAPRTSAPDPHAAIADGVLRRGERGDDVLGLQQTLNRMGIRDARGNPLVEDGRFGDRTFEAVEAYQRANGLKVDGIAGPRTLGSIGERLPPGPVSVEVIQRAVQAPLRADDPAHPDHATYRRIHDWVRGTGHWNEEQARNVSAALYREQAANPLVQRVDRISGARGPDGADNVFAVYAPHGDREPMFHARVDGRTARHEPADASLEQAERLRHAQPAPDRAQQQAQTARMA